MTDRHTVDTITSDALNALYESLDAAQQTELARQLTTCHEAFASATVRAANAERTAADLRRRLEGTHTRVLALAERLDGFARDTIRVDDRSLYASIAADLRTALGGEVPAAANPVAPEAGAILRAILAASDRPTHCHDKPAVWDGGGTCAYCTAIESARELLTEGTRA